MGNITSIDNSAKTLGTMFSDLGSPATGYDFSKVASEGQTYIRLRLREAPFSRKILPPQPITREECQRSLNHDTLVVMKDIAPEAEAVSLTFKGLPNHKYIQGDRFEIPFYQIASKIYEKSELELLAYEMPITQLLEEDIVKVIQK